jgi:hypothetical protein
MIKDLAGDSAVWRALLGAHGGRFCCFICVLVVLCQRAAEDVLRRMMGPVSGDGHRFRCCTVGELLRDCDSVSVTAVQETCDETDRYIP